MAANINFHGRLFTEGADITPAITRAAHIAKTYGVAIIKARTPVDTSELKNNWKATLEGNGIRYNNDTDYAGFVEHGTRKMSGRHMLSDSLADIEQMFYEELSREVGKQMAWDVIDNAPQPDYGNSVRPDNPVKYPEVGNRVAPKSKKGLSKKKYSKDYLFPNPRDIVPEAGKKKANAARPRWQKHPREFVPEFKIR